MPLCDSSETFVRPVQQSPSPEMRPGLAAGVSEVARFSCMKFIGVSGVFDNAGPNRDSRYHPCWCCQPPILKTLAFGMIFSELSQNGLQNRAAPSDFQLFTQSKKGIK
jgi:hypothetical protein